MSHAIWIGPDGRLLTPGGAPWPTAPRVPRQQWRLASLGDAAPVRQAVRMAAVALADHTLPGVAREPRVFMSLRVMDRVRQYDASPPLLCAAVLADAARRGCLRLRSVRAELGDEVAGILAECVLVGPRPLATLSEDALAVSLAVIAEEVRQAAQAPLDHATRVALAQVRHALQRLTHRRPALTWSDRHQVDGILAFLQARQA